MARHSLDEAIKIADYVARESKKVNMMLAKRVEGRSGVNIPHRRKAKGKKNKRRTGRANAGNEPTLQRMIENLKKKLSRFGYADQAEVVSSLSVDRPASERS